MEPVTCPQCGENDSGRFCSACGARLAAEAAPVTALKLFFAPMIDYFAMARRIASPGALAGDILSGRLHWPAVFSFALAAVALSALVQWAFPQVAPMAGAPPFVGDLAAVALISLGVVATMPIHRLLRHHRREVHFVHFACAGLLFGAFVFPWSLLTSGVMQRMSAQAAVSSLGAIAITVVTVLY